MSVSVIIPTLNAEKELPKLLYTLHRQKQRIDEIIVIDSESIDRTVEICQEDKSVSLIQIKRKDFDHGKTRDMAFRYSKGDIVVFLTQDAVPTNRYFLGNLIKPLSNDNVVLSTGRQLPKKNATRMERLVRLYNYPDTSYIRSKDDLACMGIKTFFCSDVCAAYRREVYFELGGFDYPIKTNEDMFYAAKVINANYRISYTANAMVYHSHNFTLKEQYKRNYIQGYEIERHRKELHDVAQESEGLKLVKYVSSRLLKKGHIISFVHFGLDCTARLLGSKMGERKAIKDECYNETKKAN